MANRTYYRTYALVKKANKTYAIANMRDAFIETFEDAKTIAEKLAEVEGGAEVRKHVGFSDGEVVWSV